MAIFQKVCILLGYITYKDVRRYLAVNVGCHQCHVD